MRPKWDQNDTIMEPKIESNKTENPFHCMTARNTYLKSKIADFSRKLAPQNCSGKNVKPNKEQLIKF